MNISFRALCATTIACVLFSAAKAQTDTTYYDLGRIHLKKSSTQAITVKGTDLEKMPFTNLGEAISVWFNGTLTSSSNYVYIIDGTLINDVNALSIYDIEEVTMIQNAIVTVSGASPQQTLIVIKTRKNHAQKSGFTATLQTSIISQHDNPDQQNIERTTSVYHQYNLGWYKNTTRTQSGISAGYLNDVQPDVRSTTYNPLHSPSISRFRFNAYLDSKIGSKSVLSLTAGFVPQRFTQSYRSTIIYNNSTSLVQGADTKYQQDLFQSTAKLKTRLTARLINTLAAGYQHLNDQSDFYSLTSRVPANGNSTYTISSDTKAQNYLVNDNLTYQAKVGSWEIEPAVNLAFRHFHERDNSVYLSVYNQSNPTSSGQQTQTFDSSYGYHTFLLTPNLSVRYQHAFEVIAGTQVLLNTNSLSMAKPQRFYPFAAISLNLLQLSQSDSDFGLTINGSFASVNPVIQTDQSNMLIDLPQITPVANTYYNTPITPASTEYDLYKSYHQFQAGSTFSILKNKLALLYNFSESQYLTAIVNSLPLGGTFYSYYSYIDSKLITHRIGLTAHIANSQQFSWTATLSTTFGKYTNNYPSTATVYFAGDKIVTGGFTNRLSGKNWFAGVDILYRLKGQQTISSLTNTPSDVRAFSLQNLYAGTHINNHLEVYLSTRNIAQNSKSNITDNRKFYGAGIKAGF